MFLSRKVGWLIRRCDGIQATHWDLQPLAMENWWMALWVRCRCHENKPAGSADREKREKVNKTWLVGRLKFWGCWNEFYKWHRQDIKADFARNSRGHMLEDVRPCGGVNGCLVMAVLWVILWCWHGLEVKISWSCVYAVIVQTRPTCFPLRDI